MILEGKRIFIVEDNLTNKTIMELLLEQAGAKVAIDRWGANAIKQLTKFSPLDVILLDLMLPGQLTGYDIFQQIRRLEAFRQVPIAAVSASDASTAIPKAQEMGFSGFISKPIDFLRFTQQVKQLIDGEAIWQTPERL